jgi:hypothetical protein
MRDNPNLSPEQINRSRSVAHFRSVQAGDILYEPSQPDAQSRDRRGVTTLRSGLLTSQLYLRRGSPVS